MIQSSLAVNCGIKQIIESVKQLSVDEKSLVAHCLITSLESKQDDGMDGAWTDF